MESILCKFIPNSYFDVSLLEAGIAEIDSWSMEYGYRVQHTVSTKGLFTNDVGIF